MVWRGYGVTEAPSMKTARLTLSLVSTAALLASTTTQLSAAVIVVTQVGVSFSPSTVSAAVGDTIRWNWGGQGHTVTSGSNCEGDGMFDGDLTSGSPSFEWIVPASVAGSAVDYFCAPHCFFFMTGTINVAAAGPAGDINGDRIVNGGDLTVLLSAWGTTSGPADINHDGIVSGPDLAIVLSSWTN